MIRASEAAFIQDVKVGAQSSQRIYGVPSSVTIAQAALESAWGCSGLAKRANNYFGIKAHQGEDYAEFLTHEWINAKDVVVLAKFARYPSPIESFNAHGHLLATLPRYALAMKFRTDPAQFAAGLQAGGYSTSLDPETKKPNYAAKIVQLIVEFGLTQYDIPPDPPAQYKEAAA